MVVIKSYGYHGRGDLRDLIAAKIGSSKENISYLGTLGDDRTDHIYHIYNATGLVRAAEISLTAISEEEAEKSKINLEVLLDTKLITI